jgi:hypothetical protein
MHVVGHLWLGGLNLFMRESYPASLWNAIGSIPLAVLA